MRKILQPRTVERDVYPRHFTQTNSSRFMTLPLEQAVYWEDKFGKPLMEVYMRLENHLTISATPFKTGFYIIRKINRVAEHFTQFKIAIPVEWLKCHEHDGRKVRKLEMTIGETLKIKPVLTEPRTVLASLEQKSGLLGSHGHTQPMLLTEPLLRRLRKRNGDKAVCCHKCEKQLEAGQAVVRITTRRASPHLIHTKYYHLSCYESCFI